MKFDLITYLMNPRNWWMPLLLIFAVSMIGRQTYTDAPPVASFVNQNGQAVFSKEGVQKGQEVFHQYALMEYGTMFGDGAYRGPDFTAEALSKTASYMKEYYEQHEGVKDYAAEELVKREIKQNNYHSQNNTVTLSPAQQYAAEQLLNYYNHLSQHQDPDAPFHPLKGIKTASEIKALTAFFYWGGWVCGVERPGKNYSYTHNWPYDPAAGNTPSGAVIFWSIIGSLGLIFGLGIVLYYHGKMDKLDDDVYIKNTNPFMSLKGVQRYTPTASQKTTYKFFLAAMLLFLVQVLAGVLTVHDFVKFVNFFGWNISTDLPITVTRSWHVQLSLLWISACWIGSSLFVAPIIAPAEPKNQVKWINFLFWLIILLVAGSVVGIFLGPKGLIGKNWRFWGSQGWEYVEMGRAWQWLLMGIFAVWFIALFRALRPALRKKRPWAMPNWLLYATASVIGLLVSGFIANPKTNFVIADFWRWCVIHMWAEAFFEVFTTVLVGYFMVLMGLVSRTAATRVIYIATLLFLGSGLLGISHNFYWNAKPVATMALGAVFSTLQVVPLILLTLEAWRFRKLPSLLEQKNKEKNGAMGQFGMPGVFLFLLGVNFWNFFGAGVFGFIINLPFANYFEHGTYLTVNHGHAALMGVYGNLSLAVVVFCSQLLLKSSVWKPRLIRRAFWSINIGLLLMVVLDLFPAGILQFHAVVENGLAYARSAAFIDSVPFQSMTWLRIIGGSIFLFGGVIPIVWFIVSEYRNIKSGLSIPVRESESAKLFGVPALDTEE
jgi:nitric oxide reductase subunit B